MYCVDSYYFGLDETYQPFNVILVCVGNQNNGDVLYFFFLEKLKEGRAGSGVNHNYCVVYQNGRIPVPHIENVKRRISHKTSPFRRKLHIGKEQSFGCFGSLIHTRVKPKIGFNREPMFEGNQIEREANDLL